MFNNFHLTKVWVDLYTEEPDTPRVFFFRVYWWNQPFLTIGFGFRWKEKSGGQNLEAILRIAPVRAHCIMENTFCSMSTWSLLRICDRCGEIRIWCWRKFCGFCKVDFQVWITTPSFRMSIIWTIAKFLWILKTWTPYKLKAFFVQQIRCFGARVELQYGSFGISSSMLIPFFRVYQF